MARRAWEDVKLERRSPGGERVQSRRSSQEGNHRAQWVDRLDRGEERERQQSWFDSTANSCPSDKFGHSRSNSERNDGKDVRIMADITSAHHTGLERPNLSNWSAPSAIEARMLGIVDQRPSSINILQYPSSPLKGRVQEDFASHRQSIDYGDGLQLPRSSALTSRLPQEIIDLILKLSRTQGRAQATAAERVRQLVHNKSASGLIAKESWALEVMARVLIDGDNNARTSCCACFRHLALEDDGCGHMMASPIVLTGLVTALRVGDDAAKQKAAAALGNLAWRSEETRASISKIDGVVPGLLNLLHGNSVRSKESAMAALSNITLSSSCTLAVSKSMEALGVLCEELTSGTEKGKLRAAGIIRNLASEKSTRSSLLGFPGLVPTLEHVRRETHNTETMMRTEAALICLREETMLVAQQQQQSSRMLHSPGRARDSVASNAYGSGSSRLKYGNCSEEEALIKLDEWLLKHGWKDVQSHLFDAGYTRYEEFSAIEPHMMALDEAAGLYLYEGRALQLVGADRYNPTILIDIENRQVLWDFQSHTDFSNPWARQHFICKVEGRSSMILLKRTGKVVARHDSSSSNNNSISRGHKDPGETSVVDLEDSYLSEADRSRDKSPQSRSLVLNFAHAQQTPPPEPITSPSKKTATGFPSSTSQTGPRGWTPKIVAPDKSVPLLDELLRWGSAHGWHDIQRRLLDAGKTDYSRYAFYEKEMTPVPSEKDAFNFKGKKLRLVGINRQNPRRLFDDHTKEVLWDFEKATQFTFPWARQGLRIIKEPPIGPPKAGDKLKVVDKSSAIALIELEIPPAPLVNGKDMPAQPPVSKEVVANALRPGVSSLTHSKTPLSPSGPKPEVRPPSPGPMGPPGRTGNEDVMLSEAIARLKDFTSTKGWYDLKRRLLDAGHTDYRAYAQIDQIMLPVDGETQLFCYEGRTLHLTGKRKDPILLKDHTTGEVLWDSVAAGCAEGDSLAMQSVVMESVSVVTRRNLTDLFRNDLDIVQVVRACGAHDGNQASGEASGQINLSVGDLLLVSHRGAQGWNFGKVIMDQSGNQLFKDDPTTGWSPEGWYPSTFALPLQELVLWRGKMLRMQPPDADGTVIVNDLASGELVFRGIPNAFDGPTEI